MVTIPIEDDCGIDGGYAGRIARRDAREISRVQRLIADTLGEPPDMDWSLKPGEKHSDPHRVAMYVDRLVRFKQIVEQRKKEQQK